MAGYQFLHIETYAHQASVLSGVKPTKAGVKRELAKTKAGGVLADGHGRVDGVGRGGHKTAETKAWSARDVLAEALRERGACGHVESPQAPEMLLGDLHQLAVLLDEYKRPKGVRKDAPILIAGIASAPWPPGDEKSAMWRMDVVSWLDKTYGKNLRCVIAHNDEGHDHIHFYVHNRGLEPIKNLHQGMVARQKAVDAGAPRPEQKQAFNDAMKAIQDDFFQSVSINHGHARKGPGRRRLSRAEWVSEQTQLQEIAEIKRLKNIATDELEGINRRVTDANLDAEKSEAKATEEQARAESALARAVQAEVARDKAINERDIAIQERDWLIENARSGWEKVMADARTKADEIIGRALQKAKSLEEANLVKQKQLDELIVRNQEVLRGLEGLARREADELIKRVMKMPK